MFNETITDPEILVRAFNDFFISQMVIFSFTLCIGLYDIFNLLNDFKQLKRFICRCVYLLNYFFSIGLAIELLDVASEIDLQKKQCKTISQNVMVLYIFTVITNGILYLPTAYAVSSSIVTPEKMRLARFLIFIYVVSIFTSFSFTIVFTKGKLTEEGRCIPLPNMVVFIIFNLCTEFFIKFGFVLHILSTIGTALDIRGSLIEPRFFNGDKRLSTIHQRFQWLFIFEFSNFMVVFSYVLVSIGDTSNDDLMRDAKNDTCMIHGLTMISWMVFYQSIYSRLILPLPELNCDCDIDQIKPEEKIKSYV